MKKILALTLAIIMVLLFVGCHNAELSRGSIEGDVYTNDFLGFSFTKPESWEYATDAEISRALNAGVEMLSNEDLKTALENNVTIYDMMVVDNKTRTNINVGYENLSKSFASDIAIEEYIDAFKEQLKSVSAMKVTFSDEYDTVRLGNTKFTRVICSTRLSGVTMEQVYYLRKVDNYMGFVIVTISGRYSVEQIEEMFE